MSVPLTLPVCGLTFNLYFFFQSPDGLGGEAFIAGDLFEFDFFAVFQGSKAIALDAAEMDKNVGSLCIENETKPLFGIKPLDGSGWHAVLPKQCGGACGIEVCPSATPGQKK
jgi:hypothetical protein